MTSLLDLQLLDLSAQFFVLPLKLGEFSLCLTVLRFLCLQRLQLFIEAQGLVLLDGQGMLRLHAEIRGCHQLVFQLLQLRILGG